MKIRKSIAYCYPTSPNAIEFGSHGFYVQQELLREDQTWSPGYPASPDIFDKVDDADLIQLLKESDGDYYSKYCQYFDHIGVPAID